MESFLVSSHSFHAAVVKGHPPIYLLVKQYLYFLIAGLAVFACSCGSSSDELTKTPPRTSVDQQFSEAKAAYLKEDYPEAIRLFEEVRLQAPASPVAAEATYMEAMSRYNEELYAGSAVDFRSVRRNYPNSPYAARAQFMVGESYYQLSPRPELDQAYTLLALAEFQNFLHDFPGTTNPPSPASGATAPAAPLSSLADTAQARILEIRQKLATKYFMSAQLYDKLEDFKSAAVYYKRVLDNYYDMHPAIESELRIAEISTTRNKLDDARKALDDFDTKYLQSATTEERQRALQLHTKLDQNQ
jgi:outer membrane protein assembly factor BamD